MKGDILLLAFAAMAVVTPAFAQNAAVPSGVPRTSDIPDFSGIWGHLFWPDVDAPLSGPGPVVNRSRLRNGVSNISSLVGDYTNPILKPFAANIVKQRGDMQINGLASESFGIESPLWGVRACRHPILQTCANA